MSDPNDQGRVVSDEERARALLEQLKSLHAVDIARDMVIAAVNFSYPKLGLSDETRAVRDLDDVRVSIELIRAILEVLDREHGGQGTSDLHDTLAQMQLAYGHAVQLANAERAAATGESDRPAADRRGAAADEQPGESAAASAADAADEAVPAAVAGDAPEAQDEPPAKKKPAARKKAAAKKPAAKKPAAKKPAGEEAAGEEEAGRRQLISPRCRTDEGGADELGNRLGLQRPGAPLRRRQTPESAQKRDSSSWSPGSTTMNSSSCGPATSFSRKRSDPGRCSSGRS